VRGARAERFPTLTTSPSVTRSHASQNGSAAATGASATPITSYQLPIDLSYEVDVWGRVRRNVEASVASAQASAADLETVRLSMQAELAVDYFQLRGLDAQRQLLETTVAAYEKALQLTINRHGQGVASGVDVAQAETQLHATRAQATDLALTRSQLEHAIAVLAGRPAAELAIPPAALADAPPEVPVGLPSELLERRPDIAASERRMAAANAQIGVAKAAFFPRLLLSASGGYESTKLSSLFSLASRFWAIGPSLAATLFDGGQRRATREQAQASYDGAVAGYRQTVLSAFQEVEDNLAALRILAEESSEQADAVAAAERSLALAMNRYQAGITTYLEVITAQGAALASERSAVDVLTRRMTASVNLVKAVGGDWRAQGQGQDAAAREPIGRRPASRQAW
jgi:NodT family efflux transporter outer membrane factor (OMF) lipoprotein